MIALRKSDNPTDVIPQDQHESAPAFAFGIRPFLSDNGPRDLFHRDTLGKMRLYRMYPYDNISLFFCQGLFPLFVGKINPNGEYG